MWFKIILFLITFVILLNNQIFAQNNNSNNEVYLNKLPYYTNLKKALRNKENAYKLNLSNTGLKEFPPEIFELTELRVLILDSNQLEVIPEDIKNLNKLILLSVAYNHLKTIPDNIGLLQDLSNLYIDNNNIIELPRGMFNLRNLTYLYINQNKIKTLPENLMYLKELKVFFASNNEIENIPMEIGHLYNLEKLSFSKNKLHELPEKIFELTNLKYLFLYENNLTQIDRNIKNLINLELLNISKNKIKTLPPEIDKLYSLTDLYVDSNEIDSLPKIGNLVNLKILNLNKNNINDLPKEILQLKSFEKVYLEDNPLNPFPQILYDLQNKGVKVEGLSSKKLYDAKILQSRAKNLKLIEKYPESIKYYNELLMADTNNVLAMSDLASAYLENGDFDKAKAMCEKSFLKNPDDKLILEIKKTYDKSISRTNKLTELSEEIKLKNKDNPVDTTPFFELGKHYYNKKKYEKAIDYFQKSIYSNPLHADSHFYLALTNLIEKNDSAFVFSTLRYIILNPKGKKTETILPFLMTRLNMITGVESKKGSRSYYDTYVIKDDYNNVIYTSENPVAELIIAMTLDISKNELGTDSTITDSLKQKISFKNKNNIEIFQLSVNRRCNIEKSTNEQENVFYINYYLPYFSDLIKNGYLEALSYIVNNIREKDNERYNLWLKNNSEKVDQFYTWSSNYKWDVKAVSLE